MDGFSIAVLGLALSTILCGIGSSLGLKYTVSTLSGVAAGDPSKVGKCMIIALLPATQGLYGLVISIVGMGSLTAVQADPAKGFAVFFAACIMAVSGMFSAILQGKAASSAIVAVGKKSELSGKLMMYPAMIEMYALLGLVASIIILGAI